MKEDSTSNVFQYHAYRKGLIMIHNWSTRVIEWAHGW